MKKVLVITYYWPPAGGAGVQRTLKFTKYLPEFGWKPYVLTVQNPDAPVYDESLFKDVNSEVKIFKTKAIEPFSAYKKFTGKKDDEKIPADILMKKNGSFKEKFAKFVRANFFIPDAKIGWLPYAVKKGEEIIRRENIDLIYASSPPQTVALIGHKLSKKTGVKLVVDFRDPWLEIVYNQTMKRSKITILIDSKLERKVLQNASAVVTVSNEFVDLFKSKVNEQNYFVIPNGYDEDDFPKIEKRKNSKFTIAYTGVISPDRVPYPLFYALGKLRDEGITDITCTFAGKFAEEFNNEIEKRNLQSFFELKTFLPHSESVKILLNADVLLLVINNVPDNKGVLPGKMFEYIGCKKPVFGIGPEDGEASKILAETDSGFMTDYEKNELAYERLKRLYIAWQKNENLFIFKNEKYSRRKLTKTLATVFNDKTQ